MSLRRIASLILGAVLVVAGSAIWSSRLSYGPEQQLQELLSDRLVDIPSDATTDLTAACSIAALKKGWILFVLDSTFVGDDQPRTFFETGLEPLGLFVEYDSGIVRLGLGLGPGPVSDTQVPVRLVRNERRETVFIGVTENLTRVVANARDGDVAWPGYLADEWQCNSVQIPDDSKQSTHGYTCKACDSRLRYATGTDVKELERILDSLSNVGQFNLRRWTGTSLTLLGIALLAFAARGVSRQRRRLGTPAQTSAG
jgi:hypothetical protein